MPSQPTHDPGIDALAAEAWDTYVLLHPTFATAIGDRRADDRLPPNEPSAEAALRARLAALRQRALGWDGRRGTGEDAITISALVAFLDAELDHLDARVDAWTVDPLDGPQVSFMAIESYQPSSTLDEAAAMLARWSAMGPWLDRHVGRVRSALAEGLASPSSPVRRTISEIDGLLATPVADWALLRPARDQRPAWSETERHRFADGLLAAAELGLRPALVRYRAFLADELLPAARPDERPGLGVLEGGPEAYARLVRAHTSLGLPPEEIHRVGLAESARIDEELADLAGRVLGTSDLASAVDRLREDPTLRFSSGDEVLATARRSLALAVEAIPDWFGTLPRAACEVVEIPGYEAAHSTIAYYREPAADGSRPGQYFVNATEPRTRPRYEAEALAFHESVPGHHLQIAIAQERPGLPAFRRFAGTTAFVEGWGLYSERLADEMGLYTSDLDRVGILSFDGWRASRLVVDTGMHALGWSRDRAIEFMTRHTALATNNIVNEVDRYITWPGQALAYKIGQLELVRLRGAAQDRLGAAFDIRAFHDTVLREGALPLRTLTGVVEAWLATAERAVASPR